MITKKQSTKCPVCNKLKCKHTKALKEAFSTGKQAYKSYLVKELLKLRDKN